MVDGIVVVSSVDEKMLVAKWPSKFVEKPVKGEYIRSLDGESNGIVTKVTHTLPKLAPGYCGERQPVLEIEIQ